MSHELLDPMEQILFALPERDDFMFVMSGPGFLEPGDFALDVRALPVISQASQRSDTVGGVCGRPGLAADVLDKLGLSLT